MPRHKPGRRWDADKDWPQENWQRWQHERDWDTFAHTVHESEEPPLVAERWRLLAQAHIKVASHDASSSAAGAARPASASASASPATPNEVSLALQAVKFTKLVNLVIGKPVSFAPEQFTSVVAGRPTQVLQQFGFGGVSFVPMFVW